LSRKTRDEARDRTFYHHWTLKESSIKARGLGLAIRSTVSTSCRLLSGRCAAQNNRERCGDRAGQLHKNKAEIRTRGYGDMM
jgi:4'-phosphopantetheinyl transferase superfamily protein